MNKESIVRKWWFWLLISIAIIIIIGITFLYFNFTRNVFKKMSNLDGQNTIGNYEENEIVENETFTKQETMGESQNEDNTINVLSNNSDKNNYVEDNKPSSDKSTNVSTGKRNALSQAHNYLRYMAFSKKGLQEQLEFEGYTKEEAKYGAENCGANWEKQALEKAKDYLDTSAFSKTGLQKQLEFEGFTSSEANYGVANCGANWNKQAELKAQDYMDVMSFSRQELISQLEYEGFTHAQAVHGVEAVGY